MIGTIQGTVRHKDLHTLIVETNGVGYKVYSTTDTALGAVIGEAVFLWTYLSVKENALDLFGFPDKDNLDVFELLIGISGIGPKTALSILNVASPAMLRQAVASDDTTYLTKVGGIGKKNAEKIVLELRDKLVTTSADKSANLRAEGDVMEALLSLGYDERDVRDVLKRLPKDLENTSDRVRYALKLLSESNGR
ncbi:Holliday junction branch migration protein RuvA [Candidatus Parcubacteria bacterium]|nr:Holliday junction branch migration protein RuvA [Candidatus Parcubacteria bacterium]